MKLLRKGKVKEVYDLGENLLFVFTDQISVFDKIIPSLIPDKGESLARTSNYWFEQATRLNIPNHLLEFRNKREMVVKKFDIYETGATTDKKNYLVPLEFIVRYYVAGSLLDRIEKGKTRYQDLGFRNPPKHGDKIPEPLFEMTTKFEKTDRLLDLSEAKKIGGLTDEDVENIKEMTLKMDREINSKALDRGLIHADGKKEFALDHERQPVLVDTFGTADEDRFWDLEKYNSGEVIELSKESVRQYYRSIGYHKQLYDARKKGEKEPEIPPLPPEMIQKTSQLYVDMFQRLTGQTW